jgi:hypothetical protein
VERRIRQKRKMRTSKWKKNKEAIKAQSGTSEDHLSCNNMSKNILDIS